MTNVEEKDITRQKNSGLDPSPGQNNFCDR